MAGTYQCDGGCDRATISKVYADALSRAGKRAWYYKTPRNATLADGSKKPIIVGDITVELVLRTKAGTLRLPNTRLDIIKGPEKDGILYMGKEEETRLGLKSYISKTPYNPRGILQPKRYTQEV